MQRPEMHGHDAGSGVSNGRGQQPNWIRQLSETHDESDLRVWCLCAAGFCAVGRCLCGWGCWGWCWSWAALACFCSSLLGWMEGGRCGMDGMGVTSVVHYSYSGGSGRVLV